MLAINSKDTFICLSCTHSELKVMLGQRLIPLKVPRQTLDGYILILPHYNDSLYNTDIWHFCILQLSILLQRIPIDRSIKIFLLLETLAKIMLCAIDLGKIPVISCLGYNEDVANKINTIFELISDRHDEFFICRLTSIMHNGAASMAVIFNCLSNICR